MAAQLNDAALDAAERAAFLRRWFGDTERKALGAAAGLHKLGHRRLDYFESRRAQPLFQLRAGLIEHDDTPDIDGVAGEVDRVRFAHGDALLRRNPFLDEMIGARVEGARVVEEESV